MPDPSFYRRPLPEGLIAFSSVEGRAIFGEALALGGMDGWFPLAEHLHTQSEPAFCALGSLVVVLNSLAIDPARAWKGPWRWYAEELLDCCDPLERIRERGLPLGRFACLARCNGLTAALRRADAHGEGTLREDVRAASRGGPPIVASFARGALGQTGDGHYSPIGGWHPTRDLVLVLEVARFKYPPFWVPLSRLHAAMIPHDPETDCSRGWVVLARDGTRDAQTFRIACETPGWREVVERLEAQLPAALVAARPDTAESAVALVCGLLPAEAAALLVLREDADPDVVEGLATSPLAASTPPGIDAARGVLLALAMPDAAWAGQDPALQASLATHREALPPAAAGEVARLRAQLDALRGGGDGRPAPD